MSCACAAMRTGLGAGAGAPCKRLGFLLRGFLACAAAGSAFFVPGPSCLACFGCAGEAGASQKSDRSVALFPVSVFLFSPSPGPHLFFFDPFRAGGGCGLMVVVLCVQAAQARQGLEEEREKRRETRAELERRKDQA